MWPESKTRGQAVMMVGADVSYGVRYVVRRTDARDEVVRQWCSGASDEVGGPMGTWMERPL